MGISLKTVKSNLKHNSDDYTILSIIWITAMDTSSNSILQISDPEGYPRIQSKENQDISSLPPAKDIPATKEPQVPQEVCPKQEPVSVMMIIY